VTASVCSILIWAICAVVVWRRDSGWPWLFAISVVNLALQVGVAVEAWRWRPRDSTPRRTIAVLAKRE
jgi:hypothetical protein